MDNKKFGEEIMHEIRSGKVRLRSKYVFLAEKLGMGGALAASVALAALLFSLLLFLMESSGSLGYLSFGKDGLLAFLESLPYFLIVGAIAILAFAGFLMAKGKISYKKPFAYLAGCLVLAAIIGGSLLAQAKVPEKISEKAHSPHPMGKLIKPVVCGCMGQRGHGVAGLVVELKDDRITVESRFGFQLISLEKLETEKPKIKEGQFIMAIGKKRSEIFEASKIHAIGNNNQSQKMRCKCGKTGFNKQKPYAFCPGCLEKGASAKRCPGCIDDRDNYSL